MASHEPFPLADVVSERHALPMTDDALAIQNLCQAYAVLVDNGRGRELAALFTADAEWDGTELGYGLHQGPKAIVASLVEHINPGKPMMHLPGPVLLADVDEDEIHGSSWCMATRWVDGATLPVTYFHYEDVYHRGDDQVWRFHRRYLHRRFRP